MSSEQFGAMPDGRPVHRFEISGSGLTANLLTWGATLQDLRLDGHDAPLTLGFSDFADYLGHSPYFGQTVGRYANRIAAGRFRIDDHIYQLDRNERGLTHLHGGSEGMSGDIWQMVSRSRSHVEFSLVDPDGRMGYPGTCHASARYEIRPGACLTVTYRIQTDRPTIANLAHHSYFNLDGRGDILDHDLMIAADSYLPVDEHLIPRGEILPVAGTEFDFRQMRPIRLTGAFDPVAYDHNFCLSQDREPVRPVALARSLSSGVVMEVRTGEPGIQFYAGGKIAPTPPGLGGKAYGPYSGFCLETQIWPDSPNHPGFPEAILRPGETLEQVTDYVFMKD